MGSIRKTKISFHFHPYQYENKMHVVEKSDSNGNKRRYLKGVTSGMKTDGHGERMTKKCILDMHRQAKEGTILLYEGQHGVTHTEDVGKLVDSEVSPSGEWITTYRLYDELDDIGSNTLEKSSKLWRQVGGLPPYDTPKQKGFSIEGYIPEDGILTMSENGERTIDRVDLDGVLVTPRPAYKDSVMTAIYKALDELPQDTKISVSENIRGQFVNLIEGDAAQQSYYQKRFRLDDILNEMIEKIMTEGYAVRDKLNLLFDEYKVRMIDLLVSHQGAFIRPSEKPDVPEMGAVDVAKDNAKIVRVRLLKNIQENLALFLTTRIDKSKLNLNRRISNGRRISRKNDRPRRKTHN